ncbi:ABC transporter permease [Microvirga sp. 17 mud 1-3]|uniref:ABC transporter permease n=1 Tax=Microvirga sp. 17 mud 1-3 TaxID=2082949 RepID=UPI000D6D62FB|nr:ABC transporter permease [Microvirga sp. 17 mud 1-3]AWM85450.1 ABC transporter permease [Microvirga sp. 17 mud 1-3]
MSGRLLTTKAIRGVLTIWLIVTFTFIALNMSGDPIEALVGDQASPAVIAHYRQKFGLDRPLWEQYISYLGNIIRGDFGLSLSDQKPAIELVAAALPYTLRLGLVSFIGGLIVGLIFGIVAALNRNSSLDRFIMGFAVLGFSLPNFFLGILLILLFALHWRVLPSAGADSAWHIILPAITLGTHFAGIFARFVRSTMLEVLNKQYMIAARAKGAPHFRRVFWHALPNAAIPIITIVGLKLGDLVAGSIIVETVFGWPGVGRLLVGAITSRDFAVVQAILIMVAVTMVLTNFAVDFIYTLIDPRMRTAPQGGR